MLTMRVARLGVEVRDDTCSMPFGRHPVVATSDFEEARAALESVFPPLRMHPHDQSASTSRLDMAFNSLRIGEVTASCLRFGRGIHIIADAVTFGVTVPLCGVAESRTGRRPRVLATPQVGAVFMPDQPAEVDWSDGCTQLCVTFPRRAMHLGLEAMHPLATATLEKLLIESLLVIQPHGYTDALNQPQHPCTPRAVRRTMGLIRTHPEQAWTIATLAQEGAVSARCLQEGFQRCVGVSPMRYLREVRLDRVHADLMSAASDSVTVSHIARRWGFLYLGRFAAAYRQKFGRTPSETLRGQGRATMVSGWANVATTSGRAVS